MQKKYKGKFLLIVLFICSINISKGQSQNELAILISDYIAGMTDRFALQTYEKLCQSKTS